jgi:aspartate aminotransferase
LAKKHNLYLLADEVYREFIYGDAKHFSVMHLEGVDDHCILVDSVSKRYSACGFRIGAIISKNKEVMQVAMKFAQARLSPPTFGQVASEAAIDTPESYFIEVINEYVARRNVVVEAINKMDGAFCPNPQGAFYVVARLPITDSDHFCQWLLEDYNLNGETVMLAPATGFYSTAGMGKDEVRISYVLKISDLKRSMEILEAALKVYQGRK